MKILEKSLLHALTFLSIPKHVGFIMDGNRRFAQAQGLEVGAGHLKGFEKLEQVLFYYRSVLKGGRKVVTGGLFEAGHRNSDGLRI